MEFQKYYSDTLANFPKAKRLFAQLLNHSNRGDAHAAMTPDEWDAISLYSYFVFKKEGPAPRMDQDDPGKEKKPDRFVIRNVDTGEMVEEEIGDSQQA
jgi:hypothetical protein